VERTVEARRKAGRRKDAEKVFMMAMRFDQMCKWVDAVHSSKERNYEMKRLKNESILRLSVECDLCCQVCRKLQ
jgi:hypothetical protein